jgi:hypothetical protein
MAADRIVIKTGIWHPKEVAPVYRKDGDNRIIRCALMLDGIKNVTYDEVRPDGTLIACSDCYHNEKWKRKYAIPWKNIMTDYWAWVTDIIPI